MFLPNLVERRPMLAAARSLHGRRPARDDRAHSLPGLDISTTYRAVNCNSRVGGDFCDIVSLPHGKTALIVGDVSGKGLAAALHIVKIRTALHAYLTENPDPAAALRRLNLSLYEWTDPSCDEADITPALSIAVVDQDASQVRIVTVGMDAPFILRASGVVATAGATGLFLGTDQFARFDSTTLELFPGDVLAMFTDGIVEMGTEGPRFGCGGLVDAILASRRESISTVAKSVVASALEFAGNVQTDDICLVLARRGRE